MVINTSELLDGIAILTDEQNMRVTITSSAKGAMITGATCFVGGILAGPIGLAVGGVLGGLSSWKLMQGNIFHSSLTGLGFLTNGLVSGQFKPISEVIRNDMTIRQKEMLKEHILAAVSGFEPKDLAILLPLIMGNHSIQTAVLRTVVSFITNEMHLQIVD